MPSPVDPRSARTHQAASGAGSRRRPARLWRAGLLVVGAGLAMLAIAAVLAPHSDAEKAAYAFEALLGGPRPRIVAFFTGFGTLSLMAGVFVVAVARLWALLRPAQLSRSEPHSSRRPGSPEDGNPNA